MKPKSKRKHGLSRLERALQASIRQELWIKSIRLELLELSARIARVEASPKAPNTLYYFGTQTPVSQQDQLKICPFPGCGLGVYPEHTHAAMLRPSYGGVGSLLGPIKP